MNDGPTRHFNISKLSFQHQSSQSKFPSNSEQDNLLANGDLPKNSEYVQQDSRQLAKGHGKGGGANAPHQLIHNKLSMS
jgi:hypothetical protein